MLCKRMQLKTELDLDLLNRVSSCKPGVKINVWAIQTQNIAGRVNSALGGVPYKTFSAVKGACMG